jgi:Mg-chelatase subunit ChlD
MNQRIDLVIILDRSGSMDHGREDHEGGLRSFVKDQQSLAGDVHLTFIQFDSHNPHEVIYQGEPIANVKEDRLALIPRGGTPLLDAVGEAFTSLKGKISDQAIVMIITDGQENSSHKWTKNLVTSLLQEREKAGWKILYLGANIDAFHEAGTIGIGPAMASNYSNIRNMYAVAQQNTQQTISNNLSGASWASSSMTFTEEQRRFMNQKETDTNQKRSS